MAVGRHHNTKMDSRLAESEEAEKQLHFKKIGFLDLGNDNEKGFLLESKSFNTSKKY